MTQEDGFNLNAIWKYEVKVGREVITNILTAAVAVVLLLPLLVTVVSLSRTCVHMI